MKFSEYLFNPKARQDIIIDTFCFQGKARLPFACRQGKVGTDWIFGVLKIEQALPQDRQLPSKLFSILQKDPCQENFAQALEAINGFLGLPEYQHILENLEMAIVYIGCDLNFEVSQTGEATVLIQRAQEIFDLSQNLQKKVRQGKIFSEVMSGALQPNDRLLILTKGLAQALEQLHILQTLCQVKKPRFTKKVFKSQKRALKQAFGACVVAQVKKPWLQIPNIYNKIHLTPLPSPLRKYGLKKPFLLLIILALVLALGWVLFS